jgi:gamma-glutamyltranspeptidase
MTLFGPIPSCANAIALDKPHLTGMGLMTFFRNGMPCPLFGAPGGSMIISAVL